MGPADFRSSPVMDDLLSRLQDLNIPHYSLHPADPPPSMLLLSTDPQSRTPDGPFALSMSFRCPPKQANADFPTVIDTFAPRPMAPDLSPPSSTSSERDSTSPPYLPSNHNNNHNPVLEGFVATRSRVVRLSNLPLMAHSFLSAVFLPQKNHATRGKIPEPISLWTLRDSGLNVDCVWAVFRTHEEASAVLSLSGPAMSVTGALESDLEPYQKLQPFKLKAVEDFSHVVESRVPDPSNLHHPSLPPTLPTSQLIPSHAALRQAAFLRSSSSYPDLRLVGQSMGETTPTQKQDYTISTNPPNPRSNFRIGDWICASPKCAAHNFGRNLVCIGCGCPRSNNNGLHAPLPYSLPVSSGGPRTALSPRFASQNGSYSPQPIPQGYPCPTPPVTTTTPLGALQKPAHPLLTPSGRAFAIGGRVQNISCDPLTPCIMYWPDNEPLPDQGQIRPGGLVGLNHPPILNTGNRGPISHQPGDWICKKCNYLNWRRRKVCQTCLPYAEGNGDSISTAIQAERITLLTTVLAQSHLSDAGNATPLQVIRPHSSTPPRAPESPPGLLLPTTSFHRSQSYVELTSPQYTTHHPSFAHARPIYQTSGHHRQPSPLYTTGPEILVHAPAPLLPSFLQDMVQSPTLSPSSTSSADLSSFEEDTDTITHVSDRKGEEADSPSSSPSGNNIWRLDVEESRSLNVYALQNRQDLGGFARKTSLHAMHLVR